MCICIEIFMYMYSYICTYTSFMYTPKNLYIHRVERQSRNNVASTTLWIARLHKYKPNIYTIYMHIRVWPYLLRVCIDMYTWITGRERLCAISIHIYAILPQIWWYSYIYIYIWYIERLLRYPGIYTYLCISPSNMVMFVYLYICYIERPYAIHLWLDAGTPSLYLHAYIFNIIHIHT